MKAHRSKTSTPRTGQTPRFRTPNLATPAEEEDKGLVTGNLLVTELQKRLADLDISVEDGSADLAGSRDGSTRGGAKRDMFAAARAVLSTDRRSSALEDRERALLDIVQALTQKYEPQKVDAALLHSLVRAATTCRSELEEMAALQAIPAALAQFGEEHTDFSEAYECVSDYLPRLQKRVLDAEGSVDIQAQAVTSFATLKFFVLSGGGGFEAVKLADLFLEIAEATTAAQTRLAIAALMGLGLALTLARDVDSAAIDIIPSLAPFLESSSTELVLTGAKVIALLCEKFTGSVVYDEDEAAEDKPGTLDASVALESLENALSESAKRTAKREKKERASILRDAIATVKGSRPETVGRFALSSQRTISARSWRALIVAQHLRWALGSGLHTHIANNPLIKGLASEGDDGQNELLESVSDTPEQSAQPEFGRDRASRQSTIRQARLNKLEEKGLVGHAHDDY